MEILQSYSLREHNTFGIDAQADWFIPFASIEDLQLLSRDEYFQECRCITIGEGSNLLFLTNFHGIVLHSVIQSIERCAETSDTVDLLVGSGVKWDDFVAQMAEAELYGVENLSLTIGSDILHSGSTDFAWDEGEVLNAIELGFGHLGYKVVALDA